jgi:hypothetical protein
LAFELLRIVYKFDMAHLIKITLDLIFSKDILLVIYTDFKLLYDCFIKLGITYKKRLIIDVICMREAYKRREIA